MGAPVRDPGARERIRTFLSENGPIGDPSGGATAVLKDAVGYRGSMVAFIQLISAMDKSGEILREIRGKRTYRISRNGSAAMPGSLHVEQLASQVPFVVDYDELARAFLREAIRIAAVKSVFEIEEIESLRAERDEYAAQLQRARLQLDALVGLNSVGTLRDGANTRSVGERMVGSSLGSIRASG